MCAERFEYIYANKTQFDPEILQSDQDQYNLVDELFTQINEMRTDPQTFRSKLHSRYASKELKKWTKMDEMI